MSLEGELGGRISCTLRSDTSSGAVTLGCPASNDMTEKFDFKSLRGLPGLSRQQMTEHRLHEGV